ncbi:MAG: hypothetical protein LBJ04_08415 [Sphingobacterium sp.]|nr:hypothetical protein [Sphingobacterium sp.]
MKGFTCGGGVKSLAASRGVAEQDYMIEQVKQEFECRVLWCEGRPCLEYGDLEELDEISDYVKNKFGRELSEVFFTAIESLPEDV